ncbi:MAG: FG-GAP-like repeat-containing protein [Planctomycetota bacterium]
MLQISAVALALAAPPQASFLPETPAWEVFGDAAFHEAGTRVRPAGDVNGDDIDDVIVMSPGAPLVSGLHGRGMVELFLGTRQGFSETPVWRVRGTSFQEAADRDVVGAGDLNRDGFDDIAVSSTFGQLSPPTGAVFVFYGGPNGPNGGQDALLSDADWIGRGVLPLAAGFGHSLLGPGDVDADGFDDLLVGCLYYMSPDQQHTYEGAVMLFPGGPQGLPRSGATATPADATWLIESNGFHGYLGTALHAMGDVDGDTHPDFAVTARSAPSDPSPNIRHYVMLGGPGGPATSLGGAFDSVGGGPLSGPMSEDLAAADFDGDGFVDLVVAYPGRNFFGLEPIELLRGGPSGFSPTGWRLLSSPTYEGAGHSLVAADFDGDARPDLAIVSSTFTPGPGLTAAGRVRVIRGQSAALGHPLGLGPAWEQTFETPGTGSSIVVEAIGDPEDDGTDTLAIGIGRDRVSGVQQAGRAIAFTAEGFRVDPCPSADPDWVLDGELGEQLGGEAVYGDFDGDGYDDVLVGSDHTQPGDVQMRLFRGSPSGLANAPSWTGRVPHVASVRGVVPVSSGDVNNDGFDDALVLVKGTWYFPGYRYVPGAAYVFHGGPSGLGADFAWSAEPVTQIPLHFAREGRIVGDLNGDGFDDVAIGAYGTRQLPPIFRDPFDIAGRVHVWYGSEDGLNGGVAGTESNANWTATHTDTSSFLGMRLSGAGDLDGDGCDELIAAAPFLTVGDDGYTGALYMWKGSIDGLNGGVPGNPSNAAWSAVGNEVAGQLGFAFAAGVDVDGDGVPDLATRRSAKSLPVGVDLWSGHANGFGPTPELLARTDRPHFGRHIALLEDFDGDGFGDVAVASPIASARAPRDGRIDLFRGGPGGVDPAAGWRTSGGQPNVTLAHARLIAGDGDVNGDGRSDLLSGTQKWYFQSEAEERGRVACWYGRSEPLLRVLPETSFLGDPLTVGHLGGRAGQPTVLAVVARDGQAVSPGSFILLRGTTDADACWAADWTWPERLGPGTWTLRSFVERPGGGWQRSEAVDIEILP